MCRALSHLLPRLAVLTLTFFAALTTAFVWQKLTTFQSPPATSADLFGALTPASIETPLWPEQAKQGASYWIFKRNQPASEFDVNQPIASPAPDTGSVVFGCITLTVSVDATRKLVLNGTELGSLDEPSELTGKLAEFFRERELVRAYKPGMEYRADLLLHERIEKTVVIAAPASARYSDVVKLVSIVEHTGANPIVLQVGGGMISLPLPPQTQQSGN